VTSHHLSQATHERLTAELADLTSRGRIDIANKIQAARELGDLSENGDYHAAKDEQGKMEARIRQLEAILEDAVVVDQIDTGTVSAGTIVDIRYDGDDDVERYLVGSIEERGDIDVISPTSPLGQALIGASLGDRVSYDSPGGTLTVEVVAIEA
jgi:transcription elongation factor GreA